MFAGLNDHEIAAIPSYRLALRECWLRSGKPMYLVASAIGMLENHLSRALSLNDGDTRTLADDKRIPFMVFCGNFIPWRWLTLRMQSIVPPMPGEVVDDSTRDKVAALQKNMSEVLTSLSSLSRQISEMSINGGGHRPGDTERFSMRPADTLPDWLISEAFYICELLGRG